MDVCDIESQGNGDINAENLTATKAKIRLRGNGDVRFNATETYEARLNGNGNIQNTGTGKATTIERQGNGRVINENEKPVKQVQSSMNTPPEKIKIQFQNNSALPRKVAFVFYEPSQKGSNSTSIKVLMPLTSAFFEVEVGTRFYNANSEQVDIVMSGAKLTDKPLYTVQSGDNGKVVKIFGN
jgi:DUF4097 and DUF4098 domain-containing protein YvlB